MGTIKKLLKRSALTLTANRWSQSLLDSAVATAQNLQGIGAGSEVASSGEAGVFHKLKTSVNPARKLCIFDVGANRGQYSACACECLAGRQFIIHSFEPERGAYAQLREHARSLGNVTSNNCGLGRAVGERELFYDAAGSGLASLTKRRLAHFGVAMELSDKVKISTIDDYCRNRRIERIDLLKLDVEGHELDVLHGGSEMFRQSAIHMVAFEFGGCNIDTRTFLQDFFYFFRERRMKIARIAPSGYLYEIRSYKEALEQFRTSNFLCYQG